MDNSERWRNSPDSDEPLSSQWLVSAGFRRITEFGSGLYWRLDEPNADLDIPSRVLSIYSSQAGIFDANDIDRCSLTLCDVRTRGDLRILAKALGIELN